MKITTWNVNGLRATLNKGQVGVILEHAPDFLMLQEVKAFPEQLTEEQHKSFDGYNSTWGPAEKPGYSGVTSFFKSKPAQITIGMGLSQFDREGRIILCHHEDLTIINVYVPSGQRDYGRVEFKLEFYAALLRLCDQLHTQGKQIIIGGDFNTAHQEIDLRNARQNRKTSGFLAEEREWIDRFIEHGLVDVYRVLYPDRIQYTWWTAVSNARARNIGWRLDYFLVSERLLPRVRDTIIHEDILGSDHCPVSLEID